MVSNKWRPFCLKPFENRTIRKPNRPLPFEYRTCSVFEPLLYLPRFSSFLHQNLARTYKNTKKETGTNFSYSGDPNTGKIWKPDLIYFSFCSQIRISEPDSRTSYDHSDMSDNRMPTLSVIVVNFLSALFVSNPGQYFHCQKVGLYQILYRSSWPLDSTTVTI